MADPKPGGQTTEFKYTFLAFAVSVVLQGFGIVTPEEGDQMTNYISIVGGSLVQLVALVNYVVSRTKVKQAASEEGAANTELKAAETQYKTALLTEKVEKMKAKAANAGQ